MVTSDASDSAQRPETEGHLMTTAIPEATRSEVAPPIALTAPDATPETTSPPVLTLKDVAFYYGSFRAVKDISFQVSTHQITALIGPSGSGKSTLLRAINRMNDLIP